MPHSLNFAVAVTAALFLPFAGLCGAKADPIADFYTGKQITFIVGSDPGGGYDAQARLVARHLSRFIPGNPTVLVQNMPGAGSVLMSNRIANTAAKDGTVIGLVQRGIMLSQLTGQAGIHYDVGKFNWIGSIANETLVMLARKDAPVQKAEDMLTKELVVGGAGATSDAESMSRLLNATMHTKLKIVSGYAGSNDIMLAAERGELQGGVLSWSNVKLKGLQRSMNVLLQTGLSPEPDMPDVALAIDFVKDETDRKVAELWFTQLTVARPIMAAAEVPAERVAALRQAFVAMAKDEQFLSDAKKSKLEVGPVGHEPVDRYIALTKAATPEVARRLTEILNPKS